MKKFLMSMLAISSLAVGGVATVHADGQDNLEFDTYRATRTAVKSYHFDKNIFTGEELNFNSYRYIVIPASSKQTGYTNQQINGAWNYKTYLHTNFYKGGY
ncbi:hypothetical protein [Lactobacillus sp. ESL0230]|uniref:hypothetical protein n=1 Tax=Lactobacillus sp. ESL0230 TaxID=2069353 RepID=UPI000EFC0592|nr:hypothetical protein [Lactobacillus sp. ESL0230]RMC45260.1 hypothetical protein F5ESL0230_06565 [Lactobacillus sp. ESL0230]